MLTRYTPIAAGLALALMAQGAVALEEVRINGFVTAAGTTTDADSPYNIDLARDDVRFDGRDNRLGVQVSAQINERVSATAQLIARGGPDFFDVEADWAFVGYEVSDDFEIRAGKVKIPTFLVSDYLEVGYAYPWVRPPQEVYALNPITSLAGVDAIWAPRIGDATLLVQPYVGTSQGTGFTTGQQEFVNPGLPPADRFPPAGTEVEFDAKDFVGINLALQFDVATIRAGYLTTEVSSPFGDDPSTPGNEALIQDDSATFASVGLTVDWNDFVLYAEYATRDQDDGAEIGFPDQDAYYATVGYRFGPFLPTVTYAAIEPGKDEVPWAQEQTSVAVDLRYELGSGAALKFQALSVTPEDGKVGLFDGPVTIDDASADAMVYSVALDVIF
jgi:predicted porin